VINNIKERGIQIQGTNAKRLIPTNLQFRKSFGGGANPVIVNPPTNNAAKLIG
jgi:hypothetical protein